MSFDTAAIAVHRLVRVALMLIGLVGLFILPVGAQQGGIDGVYAGIDRADGIVLTLREDPAERGLYRGVLALQDGQRLGVIGRTEGEILAGRAQAETANFYFRARANSVGVLLSLIPAEAVSTADDIATIPAEALPLVRQGTVLPRLPTRFIQPPDVSDDRIDALGFLDSYEFWRPADVVSGYVRLTDGNRKRIARFPAVQTDMLWKLCRAGIPGPQITEALAGQGVTCPQIVAEMRMIQAGAQFSNYKAEVAREKEVLRDVVACSLGMLQIAECNQVTTRAMDVIRTPRTAAEVLAVYGRG